MRELFIYYRSKEEYAPTVLARVQAFQAHLRREHPALQTRLLRRPEVKGGVITWMETYAIDPMTSGARLDMRLQQRIDAHAQSLDSLIEGERNTEVFVPCAS